mgnify:CR=1 FL=1
MLDTDKDKVTTWHDELREDFQEVYESDFMDGCINTILVFVLVSICCFGLIALGILFSYR